MTRQKPAQKSAKKRPNRDEKRIDAEIEESFPASDPPSYAGGCHAVGEPRRPKNAGKRLEAALARYILLRPGPAAFTARRSTCISTSISSRSSR